MEPSNPSVKQISYVGGCVAQCVKQAGFNLPRRGKAGSSMALWRAIDGMQRASFFLAALVAGMKPGGSQCSSWWRLEAGARGQAVRGVWDWIVVLLHGFHGTLAFLQLVTSWQRLQVSQCAFATCRHVKKKEQCLVLLGLSRITLIAMGWVY